MRASAFVLAACAAGAVWIALFGWLSDHAIRGGRTGPTVAVGVVLTPIVALVAFFGAAIIELLSCSYEDFFSEPVDCSPAKVPLTAIWVTLCCCALALTLRAVYMSGGSSGRSERLDVGYPPGPLPPRPD
jgi:hypothetical protein